LESPVLYLQTPYFSGRVLGAKLKKKIIKNQKLHFQKC
jgi:hypothetical protein